MIPLSHDRSTPLDWISRNKAIPQFLNRVEAQQYRQVLINERWICDFASCNYLGLDLHPDVIQAIPNAIKNWGTHPSWTRAVASPCLYKELEQKIATHLGVTETLVFPSLTLLHLGVIPLIARKGSVIFLDQFAHRSIHEACYVACQKGAIVVRYRHNNLCDLARKLEKYADYRTKLIAIDGVYSMKGDRSPLPGYLQLAHQYGAKLYIDDAHGFGLIGETPDSDLPYGYKGNGIVNYFGLQGNEETIIYCAGLSKAFSSYGAFITCADAEMKIQLSNAWTTVFSGPVPVASLASAIAGLEVNTREGDRFRKHIYQLTRRLLTAARAIGFEIDNQCYLPIVSIIVGDQTQMKVACQQLWQDGILITPGIYPAVPANQSVLRFSVTAANTEEEVDRAIASLESVWHHLSQGRAA